MEERLAFEVYGDPVPQGSKRAFVHPRTGKAVLIEQSAVRLRPWRALVQDAAREAGAERLEGPVGADIILYLSRPRTIKRELPWVQPDGDKLLRGFTRV